MLDSTRTNSPQKQLQAVTMAQDKLSGLSYKDIAKKHNCSKMTVSRRLRQKEIREIIDQATDEMISLAPLAVDTQYKAMSDYNDDSKLAVKAGENVLKVIGVIPSNTINQTINNIISVQNNITLNPSVAKSLQQAFNSNEDNDIIEGEYDEAI